MKRPPSSETIEDDRLRERIFELFSEHNGMAGSPMITADLHDGPQFCDVGQNRVTRLKEEGLWVRGVDLKIFHALWWITAFRFLI